MRMRPHWMNAAIASLFMVGSACFVLGSVPTYLDAVWSVVDGVTYFVGLIFTSASFPATPAGAEPVDDQLDEGNNG